MPLHIRDASLAQILNRQSPFYMARYQRHYEWGRREMHELISDLNEAYAAHNASVALGSTAGAYHFLGNIIVFMSGSNRVEVVDGQQRLTSLTLLLAVARDVAADADTINVLAPLLHVTDPSLNIPAPRLNLHRGDHEFLRDHVLPHGATRVVETLGALELASAEQMRGNVLIAKDFLARLSTSERAGFIAFVLDRSRFVELMVGREDDAFRIFETVNNRGRPIASEDVLRYALVEYATTDQAKRDELLGRWDEMEAELGPRGMKRFIAGWRARVTKGVRPRQALHRILLDSFDSPAEARAFLDSELHGDLSIFQQINAADVTLPDGADKKRIDTILRSLALVDFDEWLAVTSELIAKGLDQPQRLAADLARVERLAWYFYLNRDDKGIYLDRRDRFGSLMKTASTFGTLEGLPDKSLLNAEARLKMRDIIQERVDPKWIPLRSLLVRLEMALLGDGRVVTRGDLTIEHVLPLRPKTKGWLALYGHSQKLVTEHAERIGNLCLVSTELNTLLGNQIYPNKQRLMIQHGVPDVSLLAADIARDPVWTRDVIMRRTKWLAGVFSDTFDLTPPR
jgi:hypothetical protein